MFAMWVCVGVVVVYCSWFVWLYFDLLVGFVW